MVRTEFDEGLNTLLLDPPLWRTGGGCIGIENGSPESSGTLSNAGGLDYDSLSREMANKPEYERLIGIQEAWLKAAPQSSEARLVAARTWMNHGWFAGQTPTDNTNSVVSERMAKALELLTAAENMGNHACGTVSIAHGHGRWPRWSPAQFEALYEQGLTRADTAGAARRGKFEYVGNYGTSDDRDAFAKAATQLPDTTYAELAWNSQMRSENRVRPGIL